VKLLVLGGTLFAGRAVVEAALASGHEVTLFNRGETNPGLFPAAEHLRGNRDGDLSALAGREFDAVIDTSGYVPRVVRASADLLARTPHYCFVSSVSAYADLSTGPSEDTPTHEWDGTSEDVNEAYGQLKAACEREVETVFPGRSLIVRPGLIVGPHDPTFRFTYWVERLARGGDVLAPEPRAAPVQLIDVRDLGEWLVRCAEQRIAGTFNAIGPAQTLAMEELLETCRRVSGSDARLRWVSAELLQARGVEEWSALPLWLRDPAFRGMLETDGTRARAAGLTLRPLAETVQDTLDWIGDDAETFGALASGRKQARPGLAPDYEAELIAEAA
jgi:2'-hydroxyisoflavone reductase